MYTKEQIIDWCESSRLNRCYHCINYKPDDEGKCQIQTCGNDYFASTENYLKELAALKDGTPITDEFLTRNFTYSALSNSWDYNQLSISKAKEIDDLYYINMLFGAAVEIKTIGQLRMFFAILNEIKKLK